MDNTVGSRGVLSKRQHAILVGLLLGDGHLEWRYNFPRLRIDQSYKHKDYVNWLYSEFKDFCKEKPHRMDVVDRRTKKVYSHYLFSTTILPLLMEYHKMFYFQGKKVIPSNMISLIDNNLSIAVWYMDDGFKRNDCKSIYLCTSGFTINEQKFLQEILKEKYGFETRLHFAGRNARIYFPVPSAKQFSDLVKPYVHPVFYYKLL